MDRIILASALLLATACASYQFPATNAARSQAPLAAQLETPREIVLRDLVDFATASNMFRVEKLEPERGALLLAFGDSEPAMFVDCGNYSPGLLGDAGERGPYVEYRERVADARLMARLAIALEASAAGGTDVALDGDYVLEDHWNTWTFDSSRMDVRRAVTGAGRPGPNRPRAGPERGCRATRVAEKTVLDFLAARDARYRRQGSYDNPGTPGIPPPKSTSITVLAGSWGELAGRASACGVPDNAIASFSSRVHRTIDARDGRGWVRREAGGLYRAGFDKEKGRAAECDAVLMEYYAVASAL